MAPELNIPVCWETEKELSKHMDQATAFSFFYPPLALLSPSLFLPPPPLCPGPVGKALHQLLVIQAFRPDRLLAMASIFVTVAMGEAFQQQANHLDLAVIVENEVSTLLCGRDCDDLHAFLVLPHQIKANTPVLLSSVTGYDASGRVDDLATQLKKQCTSIAIGKG